VKTFRQHQRGLSLLEVMIVVVTVALCGLVLLPMLTRPKGNHCRISCSSQLKQVGLAFRLFSNDHDDHFPFAVSNAKGGTAEFVNSPQVFLHFQAMSNELVTPKVLVCSTDSGKLRAADFLKPIANSNVSYFVGLDADDSKPERLLSGDRNITGGTLSNGFLRVLQPKTKAGWTAAIHSNAGNIGLSDGSVYQATARELQAQLRSNTIPIIRLAIP
jgi:competence protein ComGC